MRDKMDPIQEAPADGIGTAQTRRAMKLSPEVQVEQRLGIAPVAAPGRPGRSPDRRNRQPTSRAANPQEALQREANGESPQAVADAMSVRQPTHQLPAADLYAGNSLEILAALPTASVRMCVTSPPYFGLRSYLPAGHPDKDKEIGFEQTVEDYVAQLRAVFREVRRVLTDDGTVWLNLGDTYASRSCDGIKTKDLIGIPWTVAFALRDDGWYLRSDIVWHKPNPIPENVSDRPTRAHEYLFLLTKRPRYYYDVDAVREPAVTPIDGRGSTAERKAAGHPSRYGDTESKASRGEGWSMPSLSAPAGGRNRRSVWSVPLRPCRGSHTAVMPESLVEPCILAGSATGDAVLDPFCGSGTTGVVALRHGRRFIGIDLNPEYLEFTRSRLTLPQAA